MLIRLVARRLGMQVTLAAVLAGAIPCVARAASTAAAITASADEQSGLPQLLKGGRSALRSSYAFWGANWAWADMRSTLKVTAAYRYTVSGRDDALDFDLASDVQKVSERQLAWEFTLDARSAKRDVIGGGIVFNFDLGHFGAELGEPALLPDNRGWAWGREGGSRVEMRFNPPLASVHFERGSKSELRAFFYNGTIKAGSLRHTATLTLSEQMAIGPTAGERFGLVDPTSWPADDLDWKTAPVDLSFLNETERPAGKRGFVKVAGERLVFADGSPARFWGTNITAYALFGTPKDAVRQQARRLSALGFNLVRLHHHDSPWVNPNVFGDRSNARDTQHLSAEALERIDWWIKCLKDEGIYVWLDLHVQRALRAGDNIQGFAEIGKGRNEADLKGYNYVNSTIQQAMKRFADAYMSHVNPHTGVAHKDEPAIAAVLITNENDITHHFGNSLLPDKGVPDHNKQYTREADAFAREWNLPKDKVWRAWEHGPSKLFLNDLERRFNADMVTHLRGLGVKVPIATTSMWGDNPLSSLPALTAGDVIDVHSYGGLGQLEKNPLITPNLVHWLAAGHVAGKPMTVTEWNAEPFPTLDRHALPLYVAAVSAHQGWDALMQYAYSQGPFVDAGSPSNWHAFNDPGLLSTLPAAALAYRRADVREAVTTYVLDPGPMLLNQAISPDNSPALRTAMEKGKLLIAMPQIKELPWLARSVIPMKGKLLRDPMQPVIDANSTEEESDTGELARNWGKGIYTIATSRTQAAMGWIGGETIALPDIEIRSTTRNATVSVQSLDGAAIGQSKSLLISFGARAVPTEGNKRPFRVEPVEGQLKIRAPRGLKLFKRGVRQELREITAPYNDGQYSIQLDADLRTNWLFLK